MSYDMCHACGCGEHEGPCDPETARQYLYDQARSNAAHAREERAMAWAREHLPDDLSVFEVFQEAGPEAMTEWYWRLHWAVNQLLSPDRPLSPAALADLAEQRAGEVAVEQQAYDQILALVKDPPPPPPALVELLRPKELTREAVTSALATIRRRHVPLEPGEPFQRLVVDVAEFCMDPRLGQVLATLLQLEEAVCWGTDCVHKAQGLELAHRADAERWALEAVVQRYFQERIHAPESSYRLAVCSNCWTRQPLPRLGTHKHAKEETYACDEHARWGFPEGHELHGVVHEDMRELPEAAEVRVLQQVLDRVTLPRGEDRGAP